jgi:hypothetical protein
LRRLWLQRGYLNVWRLDSNFAGHPIRVPAGPWLGVGGGSIDFLLVRNGLLVATNNFSPDGSPGNAGLYLLETSGKELRLERGLVMDASLSPNGCKLAYGFELRLDQILMDAGRRLVVLDLCGGKAAESI